mgnify:CR=1 FL=1
MTRDRLSSWLWHPMFAVIIGWLPAWQCVQRTCMLYLGFQHCRAPSLWVVPSAVTSFEEMTAYGGSTTVTD